MIRCHYVKLTHYLFTPGVGWGCFNIKMPSYPHRNPQYKDKALRLSRPRFNIKMSSYQYRKSHCGDKSVVGWYRLISTRGSPLLIRWHLYIDLAPRYPEWWFLHWKDYTIILNQGPVFYNVSIRNGPLCREYVATVWHRHYLKGLIASYLRSLDKYERDVQ